MKREVKLSLHCHLDKLSITLRPFYHSTDAAEVEFLALAPIAVSLTLLARLIVRLVMSGRVGETSLGDYAALCLRGRDNTAGHYHQSSCCHSNRPWNFMLTLNWQVCLNKRNVRLPQGD